MLYTNSSKIVSFRLSMYNFMFLLPYYGMSFDIFDIPAFQNCSNWSAVVTCFSLRNSVIILEILFKIAIPKIVCDPAQLLWLVNPYTNFVYAKQLPVDPLCLVDSHGQSDIVSTLKWRYLRRWLDVEKLAKNENCVDVILDVKTTSTL